MRQTTLVWREGLREWMEAGSVEELKRHLKRVPPPRSRRRPPERPARRKKVEAGPKAGETRTFAGIEFVWCPPGEFMMGSPESEKGRFKSEGPQHRVRLSQGFWLGKYPVTQSEWKGIMGSSISHFDGDGHPVENVPWETCQRFTKKLNGAGGEVLHLPTAAQWEYACRAGSGGA